MRLAQLGKTKCIDQKHLRSTFNTYGEYDYNFMFVDSTSQNCLLFVVEVIQ